MVKCFVCTLSIVTFYSILEKTKAEKKTSKMLPRLCDPTFLANKLFESAGDREYSIIPNLFRGGLIIFDTLVISDDYALEL